MSRAPSDAFTPRRDEYLFLPSGASVGSGHGFAPIDDGRQGARDASRGGSSGPGEARPQGADRRRRTVVRGAGGRDDDEVEKRRTRMVRREGVAAEGRRGTTGRSC